MHRILAGLLLCVGLAACSDQQLVYERPLDDGPSFSAYLVSYTSSGLKLHAMIAVPNGQAPAQGFPVVIANHGYVPDPTRYGVTAQGVDSRPGDYYRSVPELFTSRDFLVVLPDYRGHNSSEGLEFTERDDAIEFYADDVVALMSGLDEIESADLRNVFMWSHSLGGPVSMRALLDTSLIRGASFWASSSLADQTSRLHKLDVPLMIQYAAGDESVDAANSEGFAAALDASSRNYVAHRYDVADHYFVGAVRELAADRDATFFRSLLVEPGPN